MAGASSSYSHGRRQKATSTTSSTAEKSTEGGSAIASQSSTNQAGNPRLRSRSVTTMAKTSTDAPSVVSSVTTAPSVGPANVDAPPTARSVPSVHFRDVSSLQTFVLTQLKALEDGSSTDQYYLVRTVPQPAFESLDEDPGLMGARMQYDFQTGDLILKLMPGLKHEITHLDFLRTVQDKLTAMGVGRHALTPTGSATFKGNMKAKQGDSGLRPFPVRKGEEAWPTLVVECGLSESLNQLRQDARWWIENSAGNVKIVIIIAVNRSSRNFRIEKWQPGPPSAARPQTRARSRQATQTATITIVEQPPTNVLVASGELIIEFEDLMLRKPVAPEQDVVLSSLELEEWATFVLANLL